VSGRFWELVLAGSFFWILALLVVPLPPLALDLLLSLSLTLAIMILLLALTIQKPLDFSAFPSVLLMVTLLRLGLNVASTRLILTHGAEGPDAAGHVIEAFGSFTVGGNYLVGLVIFLIFVVINFVVITRGAGRIAEVAARFTLDAMPGKQMAIEADLNQGVIADAEATRRRRDVQREADFYGAMDGASKFVRGDAVAGLVILLVNVLGGLTIGLTQAGLSLAEAVETYTLLTVGDGLVSQVPALVVSTAAGVVVSRAAAGAPLAEELRSQVVMQPRALGAAAAMLGALALAPGLPFLPFAVLAGGAAWLSRRMGRVMAAERARAETAPAAPPRREEDDLRSALELDELELEIGYQLLSLVDAERGGQLLARIRGARKQLAAELGFVVPLIHIRDNLQLQPEAYAILVRGNPVASATLPAGRSLALAPSQDAPELPGIATRDPAFGLPAVWIQERDRERAASLGYAVVDASTALVTHLAEVIRQHAADLLSRQQVKELLERFAERAPRIVEEIVPQVVPVATLHRTLRALLAERVSIRDLATILETLAEWAPKQTDPEVLVELVRERLGRTITRPFLERDGSLRVLMLEPALEERLRTGLSRGDAGSALSVEPGTLEGLVGGLERAVASAGVPPDGRGPVLLSSQMIRSTLRQIVARVAPRVAVLSHNELPPDVRVIGAGVVRLADAH
jgi:flagellar biosynthesis protein FlhA